MKKRILTAFALSALVLASCSNEDKVVQEEAVPVTFTSQIGADVSSKVSGTNGNMWDVGDEIGIYMVEHGMGLDLSYVLESNVPYYTLDNKQTGNFEAVSDKIYFPVDGSAVDFIAYYPHTTANIDANNRITMDLTDQTKQAPLDLLYSVADNNGTGWSKSDRDDIMLQFDHAFSKIVIKLSTDASFTTSDVTIKLEGAHNMAYYALKTTSLIASNMVGTEIVPCAVDAPNNKLHELILPPSINYDLSDCVFTFTANAGTADEKEYTWTVSNNSAGITDFEAGNRYTFEVKLMEYEIDVQGQITEWNDIPGGTIPLD